MTYILEQYEICLLQIINCQLDSLYSDGVEEELRQILLQAISSGKIEEEQIKRLKELLLLMFMILMCKMQFHYYRLKIYIQLTI